MAKFKSLLKSPSWEVAGKKRKCYHNRTHVIQKGEPVMVVKDGMYASSGYCKLCANEMLLITRKAIDALLANYCVAPRTEIT